MRVARRFVEREYVCVGIYICAIYLFLFFWLKCASLLNLRTAVISAGCVHYCPLLSKYTQRIIRSIHTHICIYNTKAEVISPNYKLKHKSKDIQKKKINNREKNVKARAVRLAAAKLFFGLRARRQNAHFAVLPQWQEISFENFIVFLVYLSLSIPLLKCL